MRGIANARESKHCYNQHTAKPERVGTVINNLPGMIAAGEDLEDVKSNYEQGSYAAHRLKFYSGFQYREKQKR